VALHPDLVLVTKGLNRLETADALEGLESLPTPPFILIPSRRSLLLRKSFSDVLGVPEAGASVAREMQRRLAICNNGLALLAAKRVLFVVWTQPLISVGKDTFIADACAARSRLHRDPTKDGRRLALRKSPGSSLNSLFSPLRIPNRFPPLSKCSPPSRMEHRDAVAIAALR